MKRLFLFLFLFAAAFASAQNLDPLSADSITIDKNADGSYTIGVHYFFPPTDSATTAQFLQNRVKNFQTQASQLEREAQRRKEQAAREAASFEGQTGISLDSLYASVLLELEGDWTLKIEDAKDNITIKKRGKFTSKKSGDGQISVASEDKIFLTFEGQESLELFRKKESWRSLDGEKVVMERKVSAKKN